MMQFLQRGRPPSARLRRRTTTLAVLLPILVILLQDPLPAQQGVSRLFMSFKNMGRAIHDLVVDRSGTVHIAWTTMDSKVHDPGTLFYSRLDHTGSATAETQVTKFGGAYDIRIDVNARNQPVLLYCEMKKLCIACFDDAGVMQTEMDRILTPEETDARFEFSRDASDVLYLIGRGTIDYFWKIDPAGHILDERRGRWIREATPGFQCQVVNPSLVILIWSPACDTTHPKRSAAIRALKFNLGTFSDSEVRDYDLGRIAEARESGITLVSSRFVRSGNDIVFLTSMSDGASETRTYRVRFNARGDPVRRWELKRIYHLQADSPDIEGSPFRTGMLLTRHAGPTSLDLQAIGADGNIYHLNSDPPAFKAKP